MATSTFDPDDDDEVVDGFMEWAADPDAAAELEADLAATAEAEAEQRYYEAADPDLAPFEERLAMKLADLAAAAGIPPELADGPPVTSAELVAGYLRPVRLTVEHVGPPVATGGPGGTLGRDEMLKPWWDPDACRLRRVGPGVLTRGWCSGRPGEPRP